MESMKETAPLFPPLLVLVGFPLELDEGDPGTKVELGLEMHD